jgi:hypothetical protein
MLIFFPCSIIHYYFFHCMSEYHNTCASCVRLSDPSHWRSNLKFQHSLYRLGLFVDLGSMHTALVINLGYGGRLCLWLILILRPQIGSNGLAKSTCWFVVPRTLSCRCKDPFGRGESTGDSMWKISWTVLFKPTVKTPWAKIISVVVNAYDHETIEEPR